jgi:hypothetical protein
MEIPKRFSIEQSVLALFQSNAEQGLQKLLHLFFVDLTCQPTSP